MTEDELDLIASAYVDGEATPEEVALVERDPALLARVEELRSIGSQVGSVPPAPADLKERQLSAALAAFDTAPRPTGTAPETVAMGSDNVVDFADRAARQRAGPPRALTTAEGLPDRKAERSFPRWLSAAAAFILLGGGVIWLANQAGTSDGETASVAVDGADPVASTEAAIQAEVAEESGDDSGDDAAAADADTGAGETSDEAAADEAEADTTESAPAEPSTTTVEQDGDGFFDEEDAESTRGGLFPNEPVMTFDEMPKVEDALQEMPERRSDLFRSNCAEQIDIPDGAELVAFAPIEVAGEPAELFVLTDEVGTEFGLIVDADCQEMAP